MPEQPRTAETGAFTSTSPMPLDGMRLHYPASQQPPIEASQVAAPEAQAQQAQAPRTKEEAMQHLLDLTHADPSGGVSPAAGAAIQELAGQLTDDEFEEFLARLSQRPRPAGTPADSTVFTPHPSAGQQAEPTHSRPAGEAPTPASPVSDPEAPTPEATGSAQSEKTVREYLDEILQREQGTDPADHIMAAEAVLKMTPALREVYAQYRHQGRVQQTGDASSTPRFEGPGTLEKAAVAALYMSYQSDDMREAGLATNVVEDLTPEEGARYREVIQEELESREPQLHAVHSGRYALKDLTPFEQALYPIYEAAQPIASTDEPEQAPDEPEEEAPQHEPVGAEYDMLTSAQLHALVAGGKVKGALTEAAKQAWEEFEQRYEHPEAFERKPLRNEWLPLYEGYSEAREEYKADMEEWDLMKRTNLAEYYTRLNGIDVSDEYAEEIARYVEARDQERANESLAKVPRFLQRAVKWSGVVVDPEYQHNKLTRKAARLGARGEGTTNPRTNPMRNNSQRVWANNKLTPPRFDTEPERMAHAALGNLHRKELRAAVVEREQPSPRLPHIEARISQLRDTIAAQEAQYNSHDPKLDGTIATLASEYRRLDKHTAAARRLGEARDRYIDATAQKRAEDAAFNAQPLRRRLQGLEPVEPDVAEAA